MTRQYGTRVYPRLEQARATYGVATALEALGYPAIEKDAVQGVVRTAPRLIAVKTDDATAFAERDSKRVEFAWKAQVLQEGDGVRITLTVREYVNGRDDTVRPDEWTTNMQRMFDQVWHNLDDVLGVVRQGAPAPMPSD
jgi:hypothetical protein